MLGVGWGEWGPVCWGGHWWVSSVFGRSPRALKGGLRDFTAVWGAVSSVVSQGMIRRS